MKPFFTLGLMILSHLLWAQVPFYLEPLPGIFDHDILLKVNSSTGFTLEYLFSDQSADEYIPWLGDLPLTSLAGERRTYSLRIRAKNEEGEVYILNYTYIIDRTTFENTVKYPEIPPVKIERVAGVLSPQELSYDHKPWLILLNITPDPITYKITSQNTTIFQGTYVSPVELPSGANLELEVFSAGKTLQRLSYSAKDISLPNDLPQPGFFRASRSFSSPGTEWHYGTSETELSPWVNPLKIDPQPNILRAHIFIFQDPKGNKYHIPLVTEGRPIQKPTWEIKTTIPPQLRIFTPQDSLVYYTLPGGSPQPSSGTLDLSESLGVIKLESRFQDGTISEAVSIEPPQWSPYFASPNLKIKPWGLETTIPPGLILAYEVSSDPKTVRTIHINSPRTLVPGIFPTVPKGMNYKTYIRTAWMDVHGNVGKSSPIQELSVDRRVPKAPVIREAGNSIILEGSGDIYYTHGKGLMDYSTTRPETLYISPFFLEESPEPGLEIFTIAAQIRDKSGNESPLTWKKITRDKRKPGIQGFSGLTPGGIYNQPEVMIKPEIMGVTGDIWYSLSLDDKAPVDPKIGGKLLVDPLFVTASDNEEIKVTSLWNIKAGDVWFYETPVSLKITLDRKVPSSPIFTPKWGNYTLQDSSFTLKATVQDEKSKLFYSFSTVGAAPDPLGPEGQTWKESLVLNPIPGKEVIYSVKAAVVDAIGNSLSLPEIFISLNQKNISPPALKVPPLEPSDRYTLDFNSVNGKIYYEMTTSESLPPIPTKNSPVFVEPIKLFPRDDKLTIYQIRAINILDNNTISPPSEIYRIVLSPKVSSTPEEKQNSISPYKKIELTGLPLGNLSSGDLILKMKSPGAYRYELGSGISMGLSVNDFSSNFPDELKIFQVEGTSDDYHLMIQNKETLETQSFRFTIDKLPPPQPRIELIKTTETLTMQILTPEKKLEWTYVLRNLAHGKTTSLTGADSQISIPLDEASWGLVELEAVVMDEAGNRSTPMNFNTSWERNVGFLSSLIMDARGDGAFESPWTNLNTALEEGPKKGVKILVLAEGTYSSGQRIELKDMALLGGYQSDTWLPAGSGVSEISLNGTAEMWIRGNSQLTNITLNKSNSQESFIKISDAQINWNNINILQNSSGNLIEIINSQGAIDYLNIKSFGSGDKKLFTLNNSDVSLSRTQFSVLEGDNVVGFILTNSFLSLNKGIFTFKDAQNTWGLDIRDSTWTGNDCTWSILGSQEYTRLGVLSNSLWKESASTIELGSLDYITMVFSENSVINWLGNTVDFNPGNKNTVGLEFRGKNQGYFAQGLWRSPKGTPISGDKPLKWEWSSMVMEGWNKP